MKEQELLSHAQLPKLVQREDNNGACYWQHKKLGRNGSGIEEAIEEGQVDSEKKHAHAQCLRQEDPDVAVLFEEWHGAEERSHMGSSREHVAEDLHHDQRDIGDRLTLVDELAEGALVDALVAVGPLAEGEEEIVRRDIVMHGHEEVEQGLGVEGDLNA